MNTEENFNVYLKPLHQNHVTFSLRVNGADTFERLKEMIVESGGFPGILERDLRLIYGGACCEDGRTLSDFRHRNLHEGSTIHVVFRIRAN